MLQFSTCQLVERNSRCCLREIALQMWISRGKRFPRVWDNLFGIEMLQEGLNPYNKQFSMTKWVGRLHCIGGLNPSRQIVLVRLFMGSIFVIKFIAQRTQLNRTQLDRNIRCQLYSTYNRIGSYLPRPTEKGRVFFICPCMSVGIPLHSHRAFLWHICLFQAYVYPEYPEPLLFHRQMIYLRYQVRINIIGARKCRVTFAEGRCT